MKQRNSKSYKVVTNHFCSLCSSVNKGLVTALFVSGSAVCMRRGLEEYPRGGCECLDSLSSYAYCSPVVPRSLALAGHGLLLRP